MRHRAAVVFLLAGVTQAQSLRLYSEFQRVDPFGAVVSVDRVPQPREILSPAVARNAFASFQIVVNVPPRMPFFLFVQSNPENAFQVTLYKELFSKTPAGWIPDALEPMKLPSLGSLPYLPAPIEGQTTIVYWLDLWVPATAPVDRVRVEALLKIGTGWVMYPMEVRVMSAIAPSIEDRQTALPPISARADASVQGPFRAFLCADRESGREERLTVRRLIHRNAVQDLALARSLESKLGHDELRTEILRRAGIRDAAAWCRSPLAGSEAGPEWFLRVRDWLYAR